MAARLALALLLLPSLAGATSSVPLSPAQARVAREASCPVAARFVEARPERGRVVWVFDRVATSRPGECAIAETRFRVWIWEGSWSKLSGSAAYPTYVVEPRAGEEVELRLENRSIAPLPARERFTGWFLAGGDSPVKARSRR